MRQGVSPASCRNWAVLLSETCLRISDDQNVETVVLSRKCFLDRRVGSLGTHAARMSQLRKSSLTPSQLFRKQHS